MTIQRSMPMAKAAESPDLAEMQTLLAEQRRRVFLLCLGFSRNQAEAEDLTQETLIKALIALQKQGTPDPFLPWLLRIARNNCVDHVRKLRVRRLFMPWLVPETSETDAPDRLHGRQEEIGLLRKLIQELPFRLREVLLMREYAELSYQEIAKTLGIREGTVMSRLSRARSTLTKAFKEKQDGNTERR